MINFYWKIDLAEYKKNQRKIEYSTNEYPDLNDVCGDLTIEVNNKIFFKEPYFLALEFIRALEKWLNNTNKIMIYNCIETEDNPLISFILNNKGWQIISPWQLFECNDIFSKEELLEAIGYLMKSVKEQLERSDIR